MAFSYAAILYPQIDYETYSRANALVSKRRVTIQRSYNNGCRASVYADGVFSVRIGFTKIGTPQYSCQCVTYSYDYVCEHILTVAIIYDRSRGAFTPYLKLK